MRMAVCAFVLQVRWDALSEQEQEQSPPLAPDFVIELMSKSDSLKESKAKMLSDWMANGCRLGWLIDPFNQTTYIYRADESIQIIRGFDQPLSGEDVLPGLLFDLGELKP